MTEQDCGEARYNQHKDWEQEQEFYASELAKAEADIKAQEEMEIGMTEQTEESKWSKCKKCGVKFVYLNGKWICPKCRRETILTQQEVDQYLDEQQKEWEKEQSGRDWEEAKGG